MTAVTTVAHATAVMMQTQHPDERVDQHMMLARKLAFRLARTLPIFVNAAVLVSVS